MSLGLASCGEIRNGLQQQNKRAGDHSDGKILSHLHPHAIRDIHCPGSGGGGAPEPGTFKKAGEEGDGIRQDSPLSFSCLAHQPVQDSRLAMPYNDSYCVFVNKRIFEIP
jgi:hypothetical protein